MDKGITNIIFDLDGTLIDSSSSILGCFRRVLELNNIEALCPLNSDLIGPPLIQTLSRITGVSDQNILSKLADDFKAHYDHEGYKSTLPFVGVSELLQACTTSGIDLHIATNKRLVPTILILEYLGWRSYFKNIYALDSSSPTFTNKAEMLSSLLGAKKISLNSAIYVGDRLEDNESAIENNLKFYGAAWGYADQKMLSKKEIDCFYTIQQFMQHINI